jgi:pimeloyl-ACP methyl ester carboxylesterase
MAESVISRGHRISYRTAGAGPPLVLLNGWSRWADNWWDAGYVDALSDTYRVIAIDRLGHGNSDKPHDPAEYLEQSIVSDIVAVLDAERVGCALVWGYSLGARNAASLAAQEPGRVAALVCASGPPMPGTDAARQKRLDRADMVKTDDGMKNLLRALGAAEADVAESLRRNDSAALAATFAGTAEWDAVPDQIDAPSLWYSGSEETQLLSPEVLELAKRLGVETHVIPGADHAASFRRAEDALTIVRPFLDRYAHNAT